MLPRIAFSAASQKQSCRCKHRWSGPQSAVRVEDSTEYLNAQEHTSMNWVHKSYCQFHCRASALVVEEINVIRCWKSSQSGHIEMTFPGYWKMCRGTRAGVKALRPRSGALQRGLDSGPASAMLCLSGECHSIFDGPKPKQPPNSH